MRQNYNLAAIVDSHDAAMELHRVGEEEEEEVEYAIHLALLKYHEVGEYVVILAFALISGLAKLAFHHAHFVSSRVPESWSVLKRLV